MAKQRHAAIDPAAHSAIFAFADAGALTPAMAKKAESAVKARCQVCVLADRYCYPFSFIRFMSTAAVSPTRTPATVPDTHSTGI